MKSNRKKRADTSDAKKIDRTRIKEHVKTALIPVLLVTAVLMSNMIGDYVSWFGVGEDEAREIMEVVGELSYMATVEPFTIVVTSEDGHHCGYTTGTVGVSEAYESLAGVLGEALGTAGSIEPSDTDAWETALSSNGIYIDYMTNQPVYELAASLGSMAGAEISERFIRRLCLSESDSGKVLIYYINVKDKEVYKSETALPFSSLQERIVGYAPNGAYYNFEREEEFEGLPSEFLFTEQPQNLTSLEWRNPMDSTVSSEQILSAFDMSSFVALPYSEGQGSTVYVDGGAILRIGQSGDLEYRQEGATLYEYMSPSAAMDMVYNLSAEAMPYLDAELGLFVSHIEYEPEANSYDITLDYKVDGVPVRFADGTHAGSFVIVNGALESANLRLRDYMKLSSVMEPIPVIQVAALVAADGGGEPVLSYSDKGGEISAEWVMAQ